jgi:ADP-heptose:LPS heptosyltransferase
VPKPTDSRPAALDADAFPAGTPLHAFFAWNERRASRDRRYVLMQRCQRLGAEAAVAHLTGPEPPAEPAARRVVETVSAAIGVIDPEAHAAVFRAFEELAEHVDLVALARRRPLWQAPRARPKPRRILVVKLGALGDFIQALAPMPAIRVHHRGDRITLLTTAPYAGLAEETGFFDTVLVDPRPRGGDLRGWLALRRRLRAGKFDRVYDFQTSDRSNFYAWLLWPGPTPEWSGTAWHCSHPHADPDRDSQHTLDRQAGQLLMAGIHPAGGAPLLPAVGARPAAVGGRPFALLIPGSSPRHPRKRWPARQYGALARRLDEAGLTPVIIGVAEEAVIGAAIRGVCPETIDLIGRTDIAALGALAKAAALSVGNDTGATHVAAAGGNPVVVLFSDASEPRLCAPRGRSVTVLVAPDLADLPVEKVFDACRAALPAAAR